jgi:hypothetical protein
MVLYAMLPHTASNAWADAIVELKTSFDTAMRMYRTLNHDSRSPHPEPI